MPPQTAANLKLTNWLVSELSSLIDQVKQWKGEKKNTWGVVVAGMGVTIKVHFHKALCFHLV